MARVSPELLARCLDDLRSGQTTLDAVLASHPEVQQELRALLEAPLAIPRGPIAPAPSAAFRQRARAELLTRLAETPQPWWQRFFDSLAVPTPRFGLALPLLLAVLLGLGGFGGAAYAAQDTLPGDLLYPLKTGLETAQVAMTFSESGRVEEYLAQAAERLEELTLAQERGRVNALTGLSRAYANALAHAEARLERAAAAGEPLDELLTLMEQNLAQQQAALAALQSQAPPQAQEGLTRAAEAAAHGQAQAAERRQGHKPTGGGQGSGPQNGSTPDSSATPGPSAAHEACAVEAGSLAALIAQVEALPGKGESLLSKLEAADAALARCQTQAAQGQLGAFLNEMDALLRKCDISGPTYSDLFSQAVSVLTGPAGASPTDVPSPLSAAVCETAPADDRSSNKPDSPGPPEDAGSPDDRGRR